MSRKALVPPRRPVGQPEGASTHVKVFNISTQNITKGANQRKVICSDEG